MIKKKILIVGGSSFVGQSLEARLKKKYKLYLTYKNSSFARGKKNFFKLNLENKKYFNNSKVFLNYFDYIIWCVQNNTKDNNNSNKSFSVNVLGLLKFLNLVQYQKLKKLIFFSTGGIYEHSKEKITEKSKIKLKNNYERNKFFGEKICRIFSEVYDFDLIILRPFFIYGKNQKKRLIADLIHKIKRNIKIKVDGLSGPKLSCINVEDVSLLVEKLIKIKGKKISTYNISSPYSYTIRDFCKLISHKLKKDYYFFPKKNKKVLNIISAKNAITINHKFTRFEDFVEKNVI